LSDVSRCLWKFGAARRARGRAIEKYAKVRS